MLRLPPTTIVLGRSDLYDFEKRRQQRFEGLEPTLENRHGLRDEYAEPYRKPKQPVKLQDVALTYGLHTNVKKETASQPVSPHGTENQDKEEEAIVNHVINALEISEVEHSDSAEEESESVIIQGHTPENVSRGFTPEYSPPKDQFHYGGFVESPANTHTPSHSSLFAPEDVSTPANGFLSSASRTGRARILPRSPLFLSQNASVSPEGRPTTALSPRVVSRVASHNTPGFIFAQPPRRPPRRSPKAMRHQSNSFSFDSAERSSAAYDQGRASSNSTNESTIRPSGERTLRDELRGSSLQSSRNTSSVFQPPQNSPVVEDSDISYQTAREDSTSQIISPARVSLPPPFSAVPRKVSTAGSLPSSPPNDHHLADHPPTSPVQSSSSTWAYRDSRAARVLERTDTDSPTGSIDHHQFDSKFTMDEMHPEKHPEKHARTPRRTQMDDLPVRVRVEVESQTPSRNYSVYNDSLGPTSQPQTPAHLPESRHRSRFHPAYTAPVTRASARRDTVASTTPSRERPIHFFTPMRSARSSSPVGMVDDGFRGLYGGRENGDEEQNWVEGVRFNNAGTRLWGSRDTQQDVRTLRETPEPDDIRVGRRAA